MRATILHGIRDLGVSEVPDPTIDKPEGCRTIDERHATNVLVQP